MNAYACLKQLTNWPHAPKRLTRIHMDEFTIRRKAGRMISVGPIGHSICSNYRKPMKILFYLYLVQVRRALPNSGSDSPPSPSVVAFHSTPGNCHLHCNIAVVIPHPFQKNGVIHFLTHSFDFVNLVFILNIYEEQTN